LKIWGFIILGSCLILLYKGWFKLSPALADEMLYSRHGTDVGIPPWVHKGWSSRLTFY